MQATNSRKLLWDEENRLLALSDNGFVSNYWYDAAGERTVKESGGSEGVQVNGLLSGARTETNNFTAYISPVAEPDIVSQNDFPIDGPTMIFEKTVYDLGTLKKDVPVICEIKFKNTGKKDLQVINTIKNKGVISIDINRQTLNPGKQGSIKVTCSSSTIGDFRTRVIFYTNAGVPKVVQIKGIVTN